MPEPDLLPHATPPEVPPGTLPPPASADPGPASPFLPRLFPLQGSRVTVMGLGLFGGGVGVTRYLVRQGADVTVTDLRPEKDLAESLAALDGYPVRLRLGGHEESDFTSADLVVVNPAVPRASPLLAAALGAGVPLETEMNLFFKLCPAPILGVTGSNGKTTTTALVGSILQRTGRRTWVGGNIGRSLLDVVEQIHAEGIVVLELSSFQLEDLAGVRKSPHVAVVTNLTPNHLDRHGTMAAYEAAKKNIIAFQTADDHAVLNADDATVLAWEGECRGAVRSFTRKGGRPKDGAFLDRGDLCVARGGGEFRRVLPASELRIPGLFNVENALAALAASIPYDVPDATAAAALSAFRGVEHRLEFVREALGVRYFNDSIATNPESTLAALETLEGPIVLLAGGYDKKLPVDKLVEGVSRRARAAVLFGATAPDLEARLRALGGACAVVRASSLAEAVDQARGIAVPGDIVLLSPAFASFDMFRNFAERGTQFKRLVNALPAEAETPRGADAGRSV
ncbi:MAG: UDP-N-acetylmuramoyl-L-alanine--D-glutamate ligase [Planctomycetes bacterium]|nr:UDP-N-acetylmuramoyl-L-alanine--D-glutamate ligase [Planctomycetota bacterium]